MAVTVTKNDFSASKAESQAAAGPSTSRAIIRAHYGYNDPLANIYDNANNSSLPVINIDPFLMTAAVFSENLVFTEQPGDTMVGHTITPPCRYRSRIPMGSSCSAITPA